MYGSPLRGEDIVRTAWRHAESGRNDRALQGNLGSNKLRINDVVFIETTQVKQILGGTGDDNVYQAIALGDNAFGHAISLPVELRDGGILDFGREHALAYRSDWALAA